MRSFLLSAGLFLLALTIFGQTDRGTITGTVVDPTGAVVANAKIEAKNIETGTVSEAVSTTTGNFTIPQLPAAAYELSVAVPGFKKYIRQGITVGVASTIRVDVLMEVGAVTESVTVSEATPLLKTESGEVSYNMT